MIYLDTSAAIPLFIAEHASDQIVAWLLSYDGALVSSDWIVTEFASALSIKERTGHLSAKNASAAWRGFQSFCESGLRLSPVTRVAFSLAAKYARDSTSKLRSGDALHLAMTVALGATQMATLDTTLANNAKRLKIETVSF